MEIGLKVAIHKAPVIKYSLTIEKFKSEIENPLGYLKTVVDEVIRNGVSFFFSVKTGIFKRRVFPILLQDEKPELALWVSTTRYFKPYAKFPLYFTGRRFIITFDDFIQSKWLNISLERLLSIFVMHYWEEGVLKKVKYDAVIPVINAGVKSIEICWKKHIYQNDWERKIYNNTQYLLHSKMNAEETTSTINLILEKLKKLKNRPP